MWVNGKTKKIADRWMDNRQIYAFHGKSEKHVTGWIGGWMDGWMDGWIDKRTSGLID
jgi:hypothetical protein